MHADGYNTLFVCFLSDALSLHVKMNAKDFQCDNPSQMYVYNVHVFSHMHTYIYLISIFEILIPDSVEVYITIGNLGTLPAQSDVIMIVSIN